MNKPPWEAEGLSDYEKTVLMAHALTIYPQLVEALEAIESATDHMRQGADYAVTSEFNEAIYTVKAALKLTRGEE